MKKLQIVNMYKNNIVYKNHKNKLRKNTLISSVVFCLLVFTCCYTKIVGGANAGDWYSDVGAVYNPITKLYNDEENLIFTNNDNVITNNGTFVMTLVSSSVSVVNNQIEIIPIENIMCVAPCSGIVEEIGKTSDGNKYIKIKHSTKLSSIIEGVATFGIDKGNIVKQGENIATAEYNKKIVLSIYKNGKIVENLRLEKNRILWD